MKGTPILPHVDVVLGERRLSTSDLGLERVLMSTIGDVVVARDVTSRKVNRHALPVQHVTRCFGSFRFTGSHPSIVFLSHGQLFEGLGRDVLCLFVELVLQQLKKDLLFAGNAVDVIPFRIRSVHNRIVVVQVEGVPLAHLMKVIV